MNLLSNIILLANPIIMTMIISWFIAKLHDIPTLWVVVFNTITCFVMGIILILNNEFAMIISAICFLVLLVFLFISIITITISIYERKLNKRKYLTIIASSLSIYIGLIIYRLFSVFI